VDNIPAWNPALVFGAAVTAAAVVIGWMWTGLPKRPMFRKNFAHDFVICFVIVGIVVWGPWLAWRFEWARPQTDDRGRGSDCGRNCDEGCQAVAGAMRLAQYDREAKSFIEPCLPSPAGKPLPSEMAPSGTAAVRPDGDALKA